MAAVIKLKRGTSTPSTSDIANGEVAVDTSAAKLYINDSGTIKEIGGGGGGGVTSDAQDNVVGGDNAGNSLTSDGQQNTFFGQDAGANTTSGDENVGIGRHAGSGNTTGLGNIAVGPTAASSTSGTYTGSHNIAIGGASNYSGGFYNVHIGYQAGSASTSGAIENNTSVGRDTLPAMSGTCEKNSAFGYRAGKNITTGDKNVLLGSNSGNSGTNNLTTGSNNILLGYDAAASAADVSNEITLGDTNITKFRIPGINFTVKDTTATEDYVLTVDANGEAGWEAAAGGTPTAITVADESSDTTCFPLFATAATGDLGPKSGSNLTFNSSSGDLTATLLNGGAGSNLDLDFGSVA